VVKYGSNAVASEEASWADALANDSLYDTPAPGAVGQQYNDAIAATQQTNAAAAAMDDSFKALGLAPRVTWGKMALDASLNLGSINGGLHFAGSFDLSGKVDMDMSGNLQVGVLAQASATGSFHRKSSGVYTATASFTGNVLNNLANVNFTGLMTNKTGTFQYDFKGNANLSFLGDFVNANGKFRLTNMDGAEGLTASVAFKAGTDTLNVAGKGNIVFAKDWWGGQIVGGLKTPIGNVQASAQLGNVRSKTGACTGDGYSGDTINIAGTDFCKLNTTRFDAFANMTVFGQNFGLKVNADNTGIYAAAMAPMGYVNTNSVFNRQGLPGGSYNRLVHIDFWLPFTDTSADVYWGGKLELSTRPGSVPLKFSGAAAVNVCWYGCSDWFKAGVDGQFKPTKISVAVKVGPANLHFDIK
jgi:hypothetical protein